MIVSPVAVLAAGLFAKVAAAASLCRNQPGDPDYPTDDDWTQLNSTVDGRLVAAVPTAKWCADVGCSQTEWESSNLRATLPGSTVVNNWEQDYGTGTGNDSSLCLLNATSSCGQGNVVLYAINATQPEHLQAGVRFASQHNIRVVMRASGHDYLGRSTAKNALLLWTHYFQNISFTDNFIVDGKSAGPAVTVGSGVGLESYYAAASAQGRAVLGGSAGTVAPAGGWGQGAGHSVYSPIFGLGADNALEYNIVTANGTLVTANEVSHPDLFWAVRGGGGGSWGVIVNATFPTFPLFNSTIHQVTLIANSTELSGSMMATHARHIFDWDDIRAGAYFYMEASEFGSLVSLSTVFANISGEEAISRMAPLLTDLRALGVNVSNDITVTGDANVIVRNADWAIEETVLNMTTADAPTTIIPFRDDIAGFNLVMSSRFIPEDVYRNDPDSIGDMYTKVLDLGIGAVSGHLVAGGKVAENAGVNNSVNPRWRTAKTHIILSYSWEDGTTPPSVVQEIRHNLTYVATPILSAITKQDTPGSYSSEGDVLEPDFKNVFYGENYARLSEIKSAYDPEDLFIVGAGVHSDLWSADGNCRVNATSV
ncbi:unnamed protein product [Peniophora sp. CBMAI 1063]|nr:unnamed protein product [Peniophora sp. CBMAI 1063]